MEQTRRECGVVYIRNVGPAPIVMNVRRRLHLVPLGSVFGAGVRSPSQDPFVIDSSGPGEELLIRPGETIEVRDDEFTNGRDGSHIRKLVEAGLIEVVDPRTMGPEGLGVSPDFAPNMAAYSKLQGRSWAKSNYAEHPEWFEWMTDEQKADAKTPSLAPVEELFIRCPHCNKPIPKSGEMRMPNIDVIDQKTDVETRTPRRTERIEHRTTDAPPSIPGPIRSAYRKDFQPKPPPDPDMGDPRWMGDKLIDGLADRFPGIIEEAKAKMEEMKKRATGQEANRTAQCSSRLDGGTLDNYEVQRPTVSGPRSQTISISREKLAEIVAEVLKQTFDRLT